jgi:methylenetetrahydrofolate reductase (NADPH)
VTLDEIRCAERGKTALASAAGLDVTLVSQFFFECAPFLEWVSSVRSQRVRTRIVAGLAGPAGLATLCRFALRCGVGPSIRALSARPTSVMGLVGNRGPEPVVRELAQARGAGETDFDGIHLFSFGGFLRSCQWLSCVGAGDFRMNDRGGFDL